ncbi:tetratricopeptide repeat protein 4-like [Xenia sp. Carnegie-2017]|uniref:tetratricopeptide repeat protein 4-like n=1 Tax=Xenia sp. Carnegie-2017 TaxID=2897299 RepID=UPI001F03984C|nr:tetratricopeptide repeat protein 4-like [Xenia sp. Carnegie-2017]
MEEQESMAVKLDNDLNNYIDKVIEKNQNYRYEHPLSEDNWEEELENVPLFMTKSPDEINPDKAPALAAMQAIKFEEDSPYAKALSYKEDGMWNIKRKL